MHQSVAYGLKNSCALDSCWTNPPLWFIPRWACLTVGSSNITVEALENQRGTEGIYCKRTRGDVCVMCQGTYVSCVRCHV